MSWEIKKNKKGLGVYANQPYRKGEVIHVLRGRVKTPKTLYYHQGNFRRGIVDPLQIGQDKYLELDKPSVLFNHSCQPNAGLKDKSTLFALRDIEKGEEITYDYSTTIDEAFWCKCRAKRCRGVIYDFFALPPRIQHYYYIRNALPDFIKKKYERLISSNCYCGSGKKYKRCHEQ